MPRSIKPKKRPFEALNGYYFLDFNFKQQQNDELYSWISPKLVIPEISSTF